MNHKELMAGLYKRKWWKELGVVLVSNVLITNSENEIRRQSPDTLPNSGFKIKEYKKQNFDIYVTKSTEPKIKYWTCQWV